MCIQCVCMHLKGHLYFFFGGGGGGGGENNRPECN